MDKLEVKNIGEGCMKSEMNEETIEVYNNDNECIKLDIVTWNLADFNDELIWDVFEIYASIHNENNFELIYTE